MGKRFAIVICVAALGAALIAAQAAGVMAVPALASHTVKIDSRVTLPPHQDGPPGEPRPFFGRVESRKHRCKVHRLVKVYRVKPGRDHVAVKDRTTVHGKWRNRQFILLEGNYYAKVVRRKEANLVCRRDRSPRRHIEHQG